MLALLKKLFYLIILIIIILPITLIIGGISWFRSRKENKPPISEKQERNQENQWFTEKKWLTDQEIDWALEKINLDKELYKILPAYQFGDAVELERRGRASPFSPLLKELNSFEGELVFIPVNNPNTHWSLLVYECKTKLFYHYDTLNGTNYEYIKPYVSELLKGIDREEEWEEDLDRDLTKCHGINQDNSHDCGVAVIVIIKRIIDKYSDGEYDIEKHSVNVVKLGDFNFGQARKELRTEYLQENEPKN